MTASGDPYARPGALPFNAPGEITPQQAMAATSHPGAAPFTGAYREPLQTVDYTPAPKDRGGLPLANAMVQGKKESVRGRTQTEAVRSLKLRVSPSVNSFTQADVQAVRGALERGYALDAILSGNFNFKSDRTLKQLAKAVREAQQ
jgi:hypothetical protein